GGRGGSARGPVRPGARRQRRPAVRASARPPHAARRIAGRRARARRGGRRDDERAGPGGSAPLRAPLRAGQRRPFPRAGRASGRALGGSQDPEPRRRRGHARRSRAARRPPGPAHARGARRAPRRPHTVRVALLAGGFGGSRFARALAETLDPEELTVVGNVGDDLEVAGLPVSPDLDTIAYMLAGPPAGEREW